MCGSSGEWGWERLGSECLGMGLAGDLRANVGFWQEPRWGLEGAEGLTFGTWGAGPGDWVFGVES